MSAMKIKKGDTVKVIAGKDKGKDGKVLAVNVKDNTVVVENVNMVTICEAGYAYAGRKRHDTP